MHALDANLSLSSTTVCFFTGRVWGWMPHRRRCGGSARQLAHSIREPSQAAQAAAALCVGVDRLVSGHVGVAHGRRRAARLCWGGGDAGPSGGQPQLSGSCSDPRQPACASHQTVSSACPHPLPPLPRISRRAPGVQHHDVLRPALLQGSAGHARLQRGAGAVPLPLCQVSGWRFPSLQLPIPLSPTTFFNPPLPLQPVALEARHHQHSKQPQGRHHKPNRRHGRHGRRGRQTAVRPTVSPPPSWETSHR